MQKRELATFGGAVSTMSFAMSAVQNKSDFGLWLNEECTVCRPIPIVSYYERTSDHTLYHILLVYMRPALRKIDEAIPNPGSPHYIPGFEVSMRYPNTVKVLGQLVYLVAAGNRQSTITPVNFCCSPLGALSSSHAFRMPPHRSRMRRSTPSPSNAP